MMPFNIYSRLTGSQSTHQSQSMEPTVLQLQRLGEARKWLEKCQLEHTKCEVPGAQDLRLPRRVIDVGGGTDELNPFLFVPPAHAVGQWVALSHCWGNSNSLKTTTALLETHMKYLDVKKLPQTYRDAIVVTRVLGFRYLFSQRHCFRSCLKDQPNTYGSVSFKTLYLSGKKSPMPNCLAACLILAYRAAGVSTDLPAVAKSFQLQSLRVSSQVADNRRPGTSAELMRKRETVPTIPSMA